MSFFSCYSHNLSQFTRVRPVTVREQAMPPGQVCTHLFGRLRQATRPVAGASKADNFTHQQQQQQQQFNLTSCRPSTKAACCYGDEFASVHVHMRATVVVLFRYPRPLQRRLLSAWSCGACCEVLKAQVPGAAMTDSAQTSAKQDWRSKPTIWWDKYDFTNAPVCVIDVLLH
ncbi:unnamed protein product [Protopolystoma xenopodis]|uniref:Uncharacterized protein n=1 Tax=Protopolystoma xenopodis TaxID=117903 RepID=A0A3S5B9M8_9PLAT|nr:unnamed protein product [Protopolystoma xenopodis]